MKAAARELLRLWDGRMQPTASEKSSMRKESALKMVAEIHAADATAKSKMSAHDVLRALKTTKVVKKKAKPESLGPMVRDEKELTTVDSEEDKPKATYDPAKNVGQVSGTGYQFRDASRKKLVDLLIQSTKKPWLRELTKTKPSKELIYLALRLEN